MIRDEKADVLYLIMGTNPFPNIIAAITRVKEQGEIVCICTNETNKAPLRRFNNLLITRLGVNVTVSDLLVDAVDIKDVTKKIKDNLDSKLKNKEDMLIELNYTGGTKAMSSTAYRTIRNYKNNNEYNTKIILSYIDAEREELYFEYRENPLKEYNHRRVKLNSLDAKYELSIYDIISAYNNIEVMNEKKVKTNLDNEELSISLGNLFKNIDRKTYDERIKFFEDIHNIMKKEESELEEKLNQLFLNSNTGLAFESFEKLNFKNRKEGIKYFKQFTWLEEYVFSILLDLKDEKVLDDVKGNITKENPKKKETQIEENTFEVDLVAYRRYKLFAISVTAQDNVSEAKSKLYEIRQRAKDLAGDEAGMCYINLCWNTEELEEEYRNIWDDFKVKNTLIIGVDKFSRLKDELREWIIGGEDHE